MQKTTMINPHCKYDYMDEVSVDSELICSICNRPFTEPISTPCDHTFCRECINQWLDKKKKSCPTCRSQLKTIEQFTSVSRPLRNMLDRLPIKCLTCGQTGLQRENFNDHMNKICLKMIVPCTGADIKCPWTGARDELAKHLPTCKFEPLRVLLTQLITENQQWMNEKQQFVNDNKRLTEQSQQHTIQINELTNKLSNIISDLPSLEKVLEGETNAMIDLSQHKITDRNLINIIPKMMNKQYVVIQLQGNAITSQGITTLVPMLVNNSTTLKDLWLSNNCISDVGVQTLTTEFLLNNYTLKQLHLGSNCITDRGMNHLMDILEGNETITDLWLYNNQFTDQGVRNLVLLLRRENRHLKHLDLQWNKLVTDGCIDAFIKMFECNKTIERLNLRKCNLTINGKMRLMQAVSDRKDFKLYL